MRHQIAVSLATLAAFMQKRKIIIVILILAVGGVGFLIHDWRVKTRTWNDDQRVTLYSWTDENGAIHYTNTQPPDGARNVSESQGYEYVDQPLAIKIKNHAVGLYRWVKGLLFAPKAEKQKKSRS